MAPQKLSADEEALVTGVQTTVRDYCHRLGLYLLRRGDAPTPSEFQRLEAALENLVALGREKPQALNQGQRTVRESIGDILEDVEGSNCSGPPEQTLRQALASLPPP